MNEELKRRKEDILTTLGNFHSQLLSLEGSDKFILSKESYDDLKKLQSEVFSTLDRILKLH